ncbi:molybdenum cofactor biosynthesis protein MoaE [Roseivirga seohaensis subsp. aquiponti]|uniref:Molybdopterin synthase catalytic subunit n=1 Tax=Roseivirga seohaensis subsp. aquiponti TaxID=1566026 RepID=A0A0L8AJB3_9BACT|nr:molybdenum cofactor biosynthesis protein MoaE [Roseivirga seohaensis]KOF02322.1 molybdenum cofactor biosynthesis protein MoaE [Roseivirga seohaensis subsp. aquiponti]
MKTLIHITSEKLDPQACLETISYPECGGIVSFVGTVRNQTKGKPVLKLEFEAYEKMALKEMQKIADQAKIKFQVEEVLIHHRTGLVKVGEEAVVIVVAAPHRKAAFQACEYCIDTLKETVPIWKKEFFEDGEVWVSAHP